jgi:DNA-binding NtrC family response regulator
VLVNGDTIEAGAIESWLTGTSRPVLPDNYLRPGHILEDMERDVIEKTLTRFSGHRERTAKALGIGVRTLGMKLKRWREEAQTRQAG